jgi:hypothetical protein
MEKGHSPDGTSPGAYPTKILKRAKTWGWITVRHVARQPPQAENVPLTTESEEKD